ncbi:hypothetical protein EI555_018611, partial [Monodon monoceros]
VHNLAMGGPRAILPCLFGAVLCLTGIQTFESSGSQALQCYSFQHIYFGPFDLSGMKFLNVSCLLGCSEAVLSLNTGYRASLTMVQKGCWTGPATGQMQWNDKALPPNYSVTHDSLANLSRVGPDWSPGAMHNPHDRTEDRYLSVRPRSLASAQPADAQRRQDCTPEKFRRVQCHQDQSICFQGNGSMTFGNFSVPVYIRTCHRPSCTTRGTTSPWTNIDLQGCCCEGHLCLQQCLGHRPSWGAPPTVIVLHLMATLLASTLGGPLGLSS